MAYSRKKSPLAAGLIQTMTITRLDLFVEWVALSLVGKEFLILLFFIVYTHGYTNF
jgi:hypothetical protein